VQYIDFTIVKAVLVASPGFFKDAFLKYMNEQAHKQGLRVLLDNKGKFVPCHASSGNNVGLLLKVDYMIPRMILNDLLRELSVFADYCTGISCKITDVTFSMLFPRAQARNQGGARRPKHCITAGGHESGRGSTSSQRILQDAQH